MYDNNPNQHPTQQAQVPQQFQQYQPPQPYPGWPQPYQPPKPPYNGYAKASFVLGFFSFLLFPAVLAIVFGILGLREIGKYRTRGKWMAVTGISIAGFIILISVLSFLSSYAAGSTYG